MADIVTEAKNFYAISSDSEYQKFVDHNIDKRTRKIVKAILDILEIDEISIANAKFILRLCEDTIEKCTPLNTKKND